MISISFGSECVSCPSSSCVPLSHHSSQLIFSQSEPRSSNCHSFIIQRESKRENKDKKGSYKNYSKNYMLNRTAGSSSLEPYKYNCSASYSNPKKLQFFDISRSLELFYNLPTISTGMTLYHIVYIYIVYIM